MLHSCIKFLIDHRFYVILIIICIVSMGLIYVPFNTDLSVLPSDPVAVDALPDLGDNQQIIYTKWDGQSPQDIENQITYPLTSAMMGLQGVKTIRSSSMFGVSYIYIIFEDKISNRESRFQIIEKLNTIPANLLPNGVSPSLGPDATGLGFIFWYTLEGRDVDNKVTGGWDLQELRSIQDFIVKPGLSATKDVAEVASVGGHVKEYQIDVDPEKLRSYGIQT